MRIDGIFMHLVFTQRRRIDSPKSVKADEVEADSGAANGKSTSLKNAMNRR